MNLFANKPPGPNTGAVQVTRICTNGMPIHRRALAFIARALTAFFDPTGTTAQHSTGSREAGTFQISYASKLNPTGLHPLPALATIFAGPYPTTNTAPGPVNAISTWVYRHNQPAEFDTSGQRTHIVRTFGTHWSAAALALPGQHAPAPPPVGIG
jgi:hypothetical protein